MTRRVRRYQNEIAEMAPVETKEAADRLIAFLRDRDYQVRQAAAEALGHSNKKYPVPALIDALHDAHHRVRWSVVQALGWIGDSRAVMPLVERALYDPDSDVCLAAVASLQWIDDPAAIPGLVVATQHVDSTVAKAALGAINRYGEKAAPYLEKLAATGDRGEQRIAATILDRMRNPPAVEESPILPEYEATRARMQPVEHDSAPDVDPQPAPFVSIDRLPTPREPAQHARIFPEPSLPDAATRRNPTGGARPSRVSSTRVETEVNSAQAPERGGTIVLSLLGILAGIALLIVGGGTLVNAPVTMAGLALLGIGALMAEAGHLLGAIITRLGLLAMSLGALTAGAWSVLSVVQAEPGMDIQQKIPALVISGVLVLFGLRSLVEAIWRGG